MTDKKMGFYIFKGSSYVSCVFAIVSFVTLNIIGGIGWLLCSGILNFIAKRFTRDINN